MFGGYMLRIKLFGLALVGGLLGLAWLPGMAGAAPPPLPPRPTPSPTPPPTPLITPAPPNALLLLRVWGGQATSWADMQTVMQWQDAEGMWYPVDGWRGALDRVDQAIGYKTWSVPPSLFERGPFRWLIYEGTSDSVVATSAPYYLPEFGGQILTVDIHLDGMMPILLPASGSNLGVWVIGCSWLMLAAGLYMRRRKIK